MDLLKLRQALQCHLRNAVLKCVLPEAHDETKVTTPRALAEYLRLPEVSCAPRVPSAEQGRQMRELVEVRAKLVDFESILARTIGCADLTPQLRQRSQTAPASPGERGSLHAFQGQPRLHSGSPPASIASLRHMLHASTEGRIWLYLAPTVVAPPPAVDPIVATHW